MLQPSGKNANQSAGYEIFDNGSAFNFLLAATRYSKTCFPLKPLALLRYHSESPQAAEYRSCKLTCSTEQL